MMCVEIHKEESMSPLCACILKTQAVCNVLIIYDCYMNLCGYMQFSTGPCMRASVRKIYNKYSPQMRMRTVGSRRTR